MSNATPSVDQLKRAIVIQEKISKLEAELRAVLSGTASTTAPVQTSTTTVKPVKKKRKMSVAGRARISAAAKKRWADLKADKSPAPTQATPVAKSPKKAKRNISPEARAKMAAAAKKRWADVKKK